MCSGFSWLPSPRGSGQVASGPLAAARRTSFSAARSAATSGGPADRSRATISSSLGSAVATQLVSRPRTGQGPRGGDLRQAGLKKQVVAQVLRGGDLGTLTRQRVG